MTVRIPDLTLTGSYVENGKQTGLFVTMLRAINTLRDRVGGVSGAALGPLPSYTVTTLPDAAANARCLIYVSNETGGATVAFSTGSDWRRVQDRNVVS